MVPLRQQLGAVRAQLLAQWDHLDLVIYLAGDYEPMTAHNFDLATAERVHAVNFLGAMRLTDAVLPDLRPGGGLVLVASVAGYRGLPRALAYGPGKAALIHFAECLQLDLAPRGIGVWLVNPGFVATRLTAKNDFRMPSLMTPEDAARAMANGLATGRFELHFPRRFTRFMKFMALLPYRWYFPLVRRFTRG
jgi:NAD(P)-dependent dehydrogenase (short-subunit alcohol dehydrogenase family)